MVKFIPLFMLVLYCKYSFYTGVFTLESVLLRCFNLIVLLDIGEQNIDGEDSWRDDESIQGEGIDTVMA